MIYRPGSGLGTGFGPSRYAEAVEIDVKNGRPGCGLGTGFGPSTYAEAVKIDVKNGRPGYGLGTGFGQSTYAEAVKIDVKNVRADRQTDVQPHRGPPTKLLYVFTAKRRDSSNR